MQLPLLMGARSRLGDSLVDGHRRKVEDRLYELDYHLQQCALFHGLASDALYRFQLARVSERKIQIFNFDPVAIVRYGDIVIRESATCAELVLRVVDKLCGLGFDDEDRLYDIGHAKFRERLAGKDKYFGSNLVGVLDQFINSIGYETLSAYRHWVTHAGAPRVWMPKNITDAFDIPEEVGDLVPENERAIRRYCDPLILKRLMDEVEITCKEFVPPAQAVVTGHFERADENTQIPGILIRPGAVVENLTLHNVAYIQGGPMTPSTEFRANNAVSRVRRRVTPPGYNKPLAVYSAGDYLHAIRFVTMSLERYLGGPLDAEIGHFLDGRKARQTSSRKPSS